MGGMGNDELIGNKDADVLVGDNGRDSLVGGEGTDNLNGGQGADTLVGGDGIDILTGGDGADTFVIQRRDMDRIMDFRTGIDKLFLGSIQIENLVFTNETFANNEGTMISTRAGENLAFLTGVEVDSLDIDDFV